MIDELDLAFDEQAEKGRPRHRRGARGAKGKGGKSVVAFLMVFILLGVLGVGGYLGYEKIKGFFTAADYDGTGTDAVQVAILKNASLTEIGNTLVDADVVKSTAAFIEAAAENPKGKNIQSGTYNLRKQMSAKEAVVLLLDPKARVGLRRDDPRGHDRPAGLRAAGQGHRRPGQGLPGGGEGPEGARRPRLLVQPRVTTRRPPARSRASSSRTRTSSRPRPPRRRSSASWCRSSSASPVRWASSTRCRTPSRSRRTRR